MILLDRYINVYRAEAVAGNRTRYVTLTTSIDSTLQPLGDEKVALYGGTFGKMFKIFTDTGRNIREGDQVRDKDGNVYQIVAGGLENRNDGFMADYISLTVKKIN